MTRSRGCPITGVWFKLFVIGYPRDLHVNYVRFDGFFRNVLHSFQHLRKALQMFSLKRTSQKTFLTPKFVIDTIRNSNWTEWSTIQGVIVLVISRLLPE